MCKITFYCSSITTWVDAIEKKNCRMNNTASKCINMNFVEIFGYAYSFWFDVSFFFHHTYNSSRTVWPNCLGWPWPWFWVLWKDFLSFSPLSFSFSSIVMNTTQREIFLTGSAYLPQFRPAEFSNNLSWG